MVAAKRTLMRSDTRVSRAIIFVNEQGIRTARTPEGRASGSPEAARLSDMGIEDTKRGTWFSVVLGAVIGLALGVLVSVTADVPLAIEAGLVLGALAGWLSHRVRT